MEYLPITADIGQCVLDDTCQEYCQALANENIQKRPLIEQVNAHVLISHICKAILSAVCKLCVSILTTLEISARHTLRQSLRNCIGYLHSKYRCTCPTSICSQRWSRIPGACYSASTFIPPRYTKGFHTKQWCATRL